MSPILAYVDFYGSVRHSLTWVAIAGNRFVCQLFYSCYLAEQRADLKEQ